MGDTPADFLEFAHARSDQLFRTACLLTGDRHLAEDLVQETLAKMYRSWNRIDRTQAPVAYAHRAGPDLRLLSAAPQLPGTARRGASRRSGRRPRRPGAAAYPVGRPGAAPTEGPGGTGPAGYWEDRPVEETAQLTGMTIGSVRVRSLRARERLRQVLGHDFAALVRA